MQQGCPSFPTGWNVMADEQITLHSGLSCSMLWKTQQMRSTTLLLCPAEWLHGSTCRSKDIPVLRPGSRGSHQSKLPPARSLASAAQGGQFHRKRHRIEANCHRTAAAVGMRQRVLRVMLRCAVGIHPEGSIPGSGHDDSHLTATNEYMRSACNPLPFASALSQLSAC